jgi:cyanophycin synthetase
VWQHIRRENKLRLKEGTARAQTLIELDLEVCNTLTSQGLSMWSRPAKGDSIVLKRAINHNGRHENVPVNGLLCSTILESARKAVGVVGARLAGVDIVCRDASLPLESTGGAVIEVNTNPGLYYHYREGDSSFPIAEDVLSRFFRAPRSESMS